MRRSEAHVYTFIVGTLIPLAVASENRNIFVNKLANCKGFENALLDWTDVTLERDSTTKDFAFSLKLKILKEVSAKFEVEFNIWKCDQAGNLDSCEYFLKDYRNSEICSHLLEEDQFWSVFTDRFKPPLVCPIKPGTYVAKKIPFTSDFLMLLPIQASIWRARLKGFDKGEAISCVDIEIKITSDRRG